MCDFMTNIVMVAAGIQISKSLQEMARVEFEVKFFSHDDNTLLITLSVGPLPLLSV